MSLLQVKFDVQQFTFHDVAEKIFSTAMNEMSQSTRADIVFDTCREHSIKYTETTKRSEALRCHNYVLPAQMIKQWHKFLALAQNNTNLIKKKILASEWTSEKYLDKLTCLTKVFYVTCENKCFCITGVRHREVPELRCFQEEADDCMLLYPANAVKASDAILIS